MSILDEYDWIVIDIYDRIIYRYTHTLGLLMFPVAFSFSTCFLLFPCTETEVNLM